MVVWQDFQHFPQLQQDRVHVWRANLDSASSKRETLINILSADEIERANRFRFDLDRARFIAARAILRKLLSSYLSVDPRSLQFSYGKQGKPLLLGSQNQPTLDFNISHSQKYAIFGFGVERAIGVDIEYQKAMPDALKIARRFFSDKESEILVKSPSEQQSKLFFQLWTAKEAYLKAIGTGLTGSLSKVEIALEQEQKLYFAEIADAASSNWCLHSYTPACNYLGAIAFDTHTPVAQIDFWHWQDREK